MHAQGNPCQCSTMTRNRPAYLEQGAAIAHGVSKEAVNGRAARLGAQQHGAIGQYHALQQVQVVLARAVAHIDRAATDLQMHEDT